MMNLSLKVIDCFFEETDFSIIDKLSQLIFSQYKNSLRSNWKKTDFSTPIYTYIIPADSLEYSIIQNKVKEYIDDFQLPIMFYYGLPGSYTIWHNDGLYSSAVSIYLNKNWDFRNGGLFTYKDETGIHSIIPEANTGVIQTGGIYHSTTITSPEAEIRRSIQVFCKKRDLF
jgi:hypothetical protein